VILAATIAATCAAPEAITKVLLDKYQERPDSHAIAQPGTPVMLYTSDAGTWTLVALANGQACVIAFGTDWMEVVGKPNI
jgi:hypothetical protein